MIKIEKPKSLILLAVISTIFVLFYSNKIQANIKKIKNNIYSYKNDLFQLKDQQYIHPYCNCLNERILLEITSSQASVYLTTDTYQQESTNKRHLYNLTGKEINDLNFGCDIFNVLKRGKHQKILSYSIFDSADKYFNIIEKNLDRIRQLYSGYFVRFYYDDTVNDTLRCYLECKYPDLVDFCDMRHYSPSFTQLHSKKTSFIDLRSMNKRMWRFLPFGDSFVDLFLSRHTDSFVTQREKDSVNVWLRSKNIAHIMRDHPYHGIEIAGCCCGFRNEVQRDLSKYFYDKMMDPVVQSEYNPWKNNSYGYDQVFLKDIVYPLIENKSTIHDSYYCNMFHDSEPFPTQRVDNDFVGSHAYLELEPIEECPIECRPSDNQDWKYC